MYANDPEKWQHLRHAGGQGTRPLPQNTHQYVSNTQLDAGRLRDGGAAGRSPGKDQAYGSENIYAAGDCDVLYTGDAMI